MRHYGHLLGRYTIGEVANAVAHVKAEYEALVKKSGRSKRISSWVELHVVLYDEEKKAKP